MADEVGEQDQDVDAARHRALGALRRRITARDVPGDPDSSRLMHAIRHESADLKMPKAGAKLDDAIIADFEKWIALGAPDPDMEVWALEVVAERKIAAARNAVAARLGSERPEVGDAAIQAMVALADESTVGLLTRKANFADHENLRVIMEASIAIGGPDAIEFLEFVASGHPDPEIAERASEGLSHLRKQGADGEPGQKKTGSR